MLNLSLNLFVIFCLFLLYLSKISSSLDIEEKVRYPDCPELLQILNDTFVDDLKEFSKNSDDDISFVNNTASLSIPGKKIATLMASALRFIVSSEYELALDIFFTLLLQFSSFKKIKFYTGFTLILLESFDSANILFYNSVITSNWSDIKSNVASAYIFCNEGKPDKAVNLLNYQLFKLNMTDPSGFINFALAQIYEQKKDFEMAHQYYVISASQNTSNICAWLKASTLTFPTNFRNYTHAELVLLIAKKYLPQNSDISFHLALVMMNSNRYSNALLLFLESYHINPVHHVTALRHIAEILQLLNFYEESRNYYRKYFDIISATPTSSAVDFINYIRLLTSSDRPIEAYELAKSLHYTNQHDHSTTSAATTINTITNPIITNEMLHQLEIDANNSISYYDGIKQQIYELVITGQVSDADTLANSIGEPIEDRFKLFYWLTRGFANLLSGNYQDAYHYCQQGATIQPFSYIPLVCMGITSHHLQHPKEAIPFFLRAMELLQSTDDDTITNTSDLSHVLFKEASENYESNNNVTSIAMKEMVTSVTRETYQLILSLGFKMSKIDVSYSFLASLVAVRQFDECLEWSAKMMNLSTFAAANGSATILLASFVNWTRSEAVLGELERNAKTYHNLQLPVGVTLLQEVNRIQLKYLRLLDPTYTCLTSSLKPAIRKERDQAVSLILAAGLIDDHNLSTPTPLDSSTIKKRNKVVLVTQFFFTDDTLLQNNIAESLLENLRNDAIDEIMLLNEIDFDFSNLPNWQKINQIVIGSRLTFKTAFEFASMHYMRSIVIIANADIYFDETLFQLTSKDLTTKVLALSKWRRGVNGTINMDLRTDSQDAWIFLAPMHDDVIKLSDFYLGTVRCDNRLAKLFLDVHYDISNPMFIIHAIEIDDRKRHITLYDYKSSVVGPVALVLLSVDI